MPRRVEQKSLELLVPYFQFKNSHTYYYINEHKLGYNVKAKKVVVVVVVGGSQIMQQSQIQNKYKKIPVLLLHTRRIILVKLPACRHTNRNIYIVDYDTNLY